MKEAGFQTIPDEWWHFNAFSPGEVKRRYTIVEFLLSRADAEDVLHREEIFPRDENGFCFR